MPPPFLLLNVWLTKWLINCNLLPARFICIVSTDLLKGSQMSKKNGDFVPAPNRLVVPEILDEEELAKRAAILSAGCEEVSRNVGSALSYLANMAKVSPTLAFQHRHEIDGVTKQLNRLLQDPTDVYRRAARFAHLTWHLFCLENSTEEETDVAFARLINDGYLEKCSPEVSGRFKYGKLWLKVPDRAKLSNDQTSEIIAIVKAIRDRLEPFCRMRWKRESVELDSVSDMSYEEFLAGKPGNFVVCVPPEKFSSDDGVRWRHGGHIYLKSDGVKAKPIRAVGHPSFCSNVEEARQQRVVLLVSSLSNKKPPFVRCSPAIRSKVMFLWHTVKRGIVALREAEKLFPLRAEMESKALSLDMAGFFINSRAGICLASYDGVYDPPHQNNGTYNHVFFLVSRSEEGENCPMVVTEIPPHLKPLLGGCTGMEFLPGDDLFPASHLVAAIIEQVKDASRVASETEVVC